MKVNCVWIYLCVVIERGSVEGGGGLVGWGEGVGGWGGAGLEVWVINIKDLSVLFLKGQVLRFQILLVLRIH